MLAVVLYPYNIKTSYCYHDLKYKGQLLLVWLSLDTWLITVLSIAYLALLFVVAHWGQNQAPEN